LGGEKGKGRKFFSFIFLELGRVVFREKGKEEGRILNLLNFIYWEETEGREKKKKREGLLLSQSADCGQMNVGITKKVGLVRRGKGGRERAVMLLDSPLLYEGEGRREGKGKE